WFSVRSDAAQQGTAEQTNQVVNPFKRLLDKPGPWLANPLDAFWKKEKGTDNVRSVAIGLVGAFVVIGALFTLAMQIRSRHGAAFLRAFPVVFLLAGLAYVLAGQKVVKAYNLE